MPLKKRVLIYLVIPVLLLITIGVVGIYSQVRLEESASKILSDNYHSIQAARTMERTLRDLEIHSVDRNDGRVIDQPIEELTLRFEQALTRCESNITEPEEASILEQIRPIWREVQLELLPADGAEEPRKTRARDWVRLTAPLFRKIDALVDINERAMIDYKRGQERTARLLRLVMIGSVGSVLLALIAFSLIAADRISRPVLEVAEDLHRALEESDGPGGPKAAPTGDEIGRLRLELDDLLTRLARHERRQERRFSDLEGRFSMVMEGVREGLVLLDEDLNILAVNQVGSSILGLPGVELGPGANLRDLDLDKDMEKTLAPIREGEAETYPALDLDVVRRESGGQDKFYEPRMLPLSPSYEGPRGFLLIFWDVTKDHRFKEARRQFIAMLSHQLKTPITSLSISVNLLSEKWSGQDKDSDELLAIARSDCSLLMSLLYELIDAARNIILKMSLHPKRLDLVQLLRSSTLSMVSQLRKKGVDFHDELGQIPVAADIDPVKFPWVVTNIMGNAMRHTGPGDSVTLSLARLEGQVEIAISDTGAGIAKDHLSQLFTPYTSFDDKKEAGSLGLGLTIAKEIIESHKGTIRVESELGAGSRFIINLPLEMEAGN